MSHLWRKSVVRSCRAAVVPSYGGPEVLQIRNVNVPELKQCEVLVRTRAVSLNRIDSRMREGYGRSITREHLPNLILGRDVSGEVAALGPASTRGFKVGQQVFGALDSMELRGTYADFVIFPEYCLTHKPETISHVEACAIPYAYQNAWTALMGYGRLKTGRKVLVLGGKEADAAAAVQIAEYARCHVSVISFTESEANALAATLKHLKLDFGAQHQLLEKLRMFQRSGCKGDFDLVLDTVNSPESRELGICSLKKGGIYSCLLDDIPFNADRFGVGLGIVADVIRALWHRLRYENPHEIIYRPAWPRMAERHTYETLHHRVDNNLRIGVGKTFPFTQVREAHEALDDGSVDGKIVLQW